MNIKSFGTVKSDRLKQRMDTVCEAACLLLQSKRRTGNI